MFEGSHIDAEVNGRAYDVSRDGQRLIKAGGATDDTSTAAQIILIEN